MEGELLSWRLNPPPSQDTDLSQSEDSLDLLMST